MVVAALHEHLGNADAGEVIELGPYLSKIVILINSTLVADVSVQGSFENVIVRLKWHSKLPAWLWRISLTKRTSAASSGDEKTGRTFS